MQELIGFYRKKGIILIIHTIIVIGIGVVHAATEVASFRYSFVDQEQLADSEENALGISQFNFEVYQESVLVQSVTTAETKNEIYILVPELNESTNTAIYTSNVYNYPNPFQLKSGTLIGYTLSKDMAIQLRIYNMFGHLIYQEDYNEGENGGKGTPSYNKIEFSNDTVYGRNLSSGAYFYVLIYNGSVIGKGKMAVIP